MSLTVDEFKSVLRRKAEKAGGIRKLAKQLGVNHSHLAMTLAHEGIAPIPSIVRAAGYRLDSTVYYERIR